jgi:hypothetical protein
MNRWLAACALGIGLTLGAQTYEQDAAIERRICTSALTETLRDRDIYATRGKSAEVLVVIRRPYMWFAHTTDEWLFKNRIAWRLKGFKTVEFANFPFDSTPKADCIEIEELHGTKHIVTIYRREDLW